MTLRKAMALATVSVYSFAAGVVLSQRLGATVTSFVFHREAALVTTQDLYFRDTAESSFGSAGGFQQGTAASVRQLHQRFNFLLVVPLTGTGQGEFYGLPLRRR
jgi:hypothetical protein